MKELPAIWTEAVADSNSLCIASILPIHELYRMTKKILFLHGFFASGACIPACTLKQCFEGKAEVLTPDLPLHPLEALAFIRRLCEQEQPDILVGNSNGSFLAQIVASRIGNHTYKSPRTDGNQQFTITPDLIDEFAGLQIHQWDFCSPANQNRIWGLFGENDHLAHYEPLFREHYSHVFHFPGAHTPTAEEVQKYYVPLVKKLMELSCNES